MTAKIQQGLDAVWSCFAVLFFLGLLIWQSAQAEIRGPIKVRTDNGTFIFPREFAAADIWKTLKIKPFETNYFLFRLLLQNQHILILIHVQQFLTHDLC